MKNIGLKLVFWAFLIIFTTELGFSYLSEMPFDGNIWSFLIKTFCMSVVFIFLLLNFLVRPLTMKNLAKIGLKIEDYDWSAEQNLKLPNTTQNWDKLKKIIPKLGFQLIKNDENNLIFESKLNYQSWGGYLLVNTDNQDIVVTSRPKFKFNFVDYGLNKVIIETLKKELQLT